jgi:hypothetical protein
LLLPAPRSQLCAVPYKGLGALSFAGVAPEMFAEFIREGRQPPGEDFEITDCDLILDRSQVSIVLRDNRDRWS